MTKNEVQDFMQRIKAHYQEFVIDEFKYNEWCEQLKEYKADEINQRFEQHLKSETYGEFIPKINFLTKGLRKESDKGYDLSKIYVRCRTCGQMMSLEEDKKHTDRCKDVDYMLFLLDKYTGKNADRINLLKMEENQFKEKFKKMVVYAYQNEGNEEEKKRLKEIYELS